jgi:acyl-CoA dehydrogenase
MQSTLLSEMWTYARFVRVVDGPDAAHRHQVGRDRLKRAGQMKSKHDGYEKRSKEIAKAWGALCQMVSAFPY